MISLFKIYFASFFFNVYIMQCTLYVYIQWVWCVGPNFHLLLNTGVTGAHKLPFHPPHLNPQVLSAVVLLLALNCSCDPINLNELACYERRHCALFLFPPAVLFYPNVTQRGDQVHIKTRSSDMDRFGHAWKGVPRRWYSVQTCSTLKAEALVRSCKRMCMCTHSDAFYRMKRHKRADFQMWALLQ